MYNSTRLSRALAYLLTIILLLGMAPATTGVAVEIPDRMHISPIGGIA